MNAIFKRGISVILSIILIMSSFVGVMAAEIGDFSDFPTGWSREAVTAAVNNGLLTGMGDGTIAPGANLTRAQMAAIINRAFGATVKKDISAFTDVAKDSWYYDDIAKAVNMGTFAGTGSGKMNPDADITRQEVFAVIARALVLDSGTKEDLAKFGDAGNVAAWAMGDVAALASKGYVSGYSDGTLLPTANITREEFAQVMHNIFKTYISEPGVVTSVANSGCVMIRTPGVIIKDVEIKGDLVLGDGVGAGDVEIINVKIGGRLLCRGGEGKVTLKNTTTGGGVVVKDVNGVVNFNNYRSESVFDGVKELTRATYLSQGEAVDLGPVRFPNGGSGGVSPVIKHTVKVDTGSDEYSMSIPEGEKLYDYLPKNPTLTGKDFDGWYYIDKNGNEQKVDETTVVTGSMTVYAKWKAKVFTVTFYKDSSLADEVSEEKVNYGEKVTTLPVAPEKEGYTFAGWYYKDAQGKESVFDKTVEVYGNMKIYPKYTVNKYTVTFYKDSSLADKIASEEVEYGKTVSSLPSTPQNSGFTFAGWYYKDGGEKEFTANTVIKTDLSVYAKWTPAGGTVTYTVEFYADETLATKIETQIIEQGKGVTSLPAAPSKEGYTFVAWVYKDAQGNECVLDKNVAVNGDMKIYPKYSINKYTVTFYKDSALTEKIASEEVEYGKTVSSVPAAPSKDGYTFDGWYYNDGAEKEFTANTAVKTDLSVYAKWTPVAGPVTYTVDFYADETFANKIETQTIEQGKKVTSLPVAPSKEGYTFAGWAYKDAQGNERVFDETVEVYGDMKIYPKYTANKYTVTFYKDSSLADKIASEEVEYGKTVSSVPVAPSKDGYTFAGWYYKDGGEKEFTANIVVKTDLSVYAKWTPEGVTVTYTVEFYSDETLATKIETQTIEQGKNVTSLPAAPSKEGYTFAGWVYKDAQGNECVFDETVAVNGDMKIYPKYTVNKYTVTFYKDSSLAEKIASEEVEYGNTVSSIPAAPSKEGYTFVAWVYKDAQGNECVFDETVAVNGDMNVYPKYSINEYTVTFYKDETLTEVVATETADYNETIAVLPAAPSVVGNTFKGWFYVENGTEVPFETTTVVKGDMSVYAKWEKNEYTVTFYKLPGEAVASETVVYGGKVSALPEAPVYNDYVFRGWYYVVDGVKQEFTADIIITDNTDVYADWEALLDVSFYEDDTLSKLVAVFKVENGAAVSVLPEAPEREGYKFLGWFYDNAGTKAEFTTSVVVTSATDVYGEWELKKYTVSFYDGYTSTLDESYLENSCVVEHGDTTPAPEFPAGFTVPGYVKHSGFDKVYTNLYTHNVSSEWWYIDDSGEWAIFDENVEITRDINTFKMVKYLAVNVGGDKFVDKFGRRVMISVPYDSETRLNDSVKDFVYFVRNDIELMLDTTGVYQKLLDKLSSLKYQVIDSEGNVLNQKYDIKIVEVISADEIEAEIEAYLTSMIENGGEDLKTLLNFVSIEDLIEAVGIEAILDNLSDEALLEILKDDAVRPTVVGFLKAKVEGNADIREAVTEHITEKIRADQNYRNKIVEYIKQQVKAGNTEIINMLAGYIQTALTDEANSDLRNTAATFFIDKVVSDEDFRMSMIKDDNFVKGIFENDLFKEQIIKNVAEHVNLIIELVKDDTVRGKIADSLQDNDEFVEFILDHDGFESSFKTSIKDAQNAQKLKNLLQSSQQLGAEVISVLRGNSEFENYLEDDDFASEVAGNISSSADMKNKNSSLHKRILESAMNSSAFKNEINSNNSVKAQIVTVLSANNEFIRLVREELGLLDLPEVNAEIASYLNQYIANPSGSIVVGGTDVAAVINDKIRDILDNGDSYDASFTDSIRNQLSDYIVSYANGDVSLNAKLKDAIDSIIESQTEKIITDYLGGTLDSSISEIIDDAIINLVCDYLDGAVNNRIDNIITDALYDYARNIIDGTASAPTAEVETFIEDVKNKAVEKLIDDASEFVELVEEFLETDSNRVYIEAAIAEGYNDIKSYIINHRNDTDVAVNKALSDFLLANAGDAHAAEVVVGYLKSHQLDFDLVAELIKQEIDSIDDALIVSYIVNNIGTMGELIEDYLLSEINNPTNEIDATIDDYILNDLDTATVAKFRELIVSDDDIGNLISSYIQNDRDAFIEKVIKIIENMDTVQKRKLVDDVIAKLQELPYYVDFMNSFKNGDDTFVVNQSNISFVMGVASAIRNYTFDMLKDRIYANETFEKVIKFIGEDVVSGYMNEAVTDYYDGVVEIRDQIEADKLAGESKEYSYKTSLTFKANLFADILVPKYDEITEKVYAKVDALNKGDYSNNPYLKALVEKNLFDAVFDKTPGGATEDLSGYALKKDPMAFYDFVYSLILLSDDAMLHYDYISYDDIYNAIAPYAVKLANKSLDIVKDFDEDGSLPAGLDGKLQSIAKVKDYYDTIEGLLNSVADVIIGSRLDDEYTEDKLKNNGVQAATKAINAFFSVLNEYNESGELPAKLQPVLERVAKVKSIFEENKGNIDALVAKLADLKINHVYTEEEVASYEQYVKELYEMLNGTGDSVLNVDRAYEIVEIFVGDLMARFSYEPVESEGVVYEDAYRAALKGIEVAFIRYFI